MNKTPVFASTVDASGVIPARFALFVNVFLLKPALTPQPQLVRNAVRKVPFHQPHQLSAAA